MVALRTHALSGLQLGCFVRGWHDMAAVPVQRFTLSDAELALLYRCSRFTLYPSLYEGWGLPVTEALCQGKLPVIADNSSLPEAGAGLTLVVPEGSTTAWVDAIGRALFDDEWRARHEARIVAGFRPRSWSAIASDVVDAALRLAAPDGGKQAMAAIDGWRERREGA